MSVFFISHSLITSACSDGFDLFSISWAFANSTQETYLKTKTALHNIKTKNIISSNSSNININAVIMPLADIKRIKASTAAKVNGIAAIKSNIEISFNPPPAIDKLVAKGLLG